MNKLITLAFIACIALSSQHAFSQTIVLINGQATEVVLSGKDIKTIVNNKISNYMEQYTASADEEFVHAEFRLNNEDQKEIAPVSNASVDTEVIEFPLAQHLGTYNDRPSGFKEK